MPDPHRHPHTKSSMVGGHAEDHAARPRGESFDTAPLAALLNHNGHKRRDRVRTNRLTPSRSEHAPVRRTLLQLPRREFVGELALLTSLDHTDRAGVDADDAGPAALGRPLDPLPHDERDRALA